MTVDIRSELGGSQKIARLGADLQAVTLTEVGERFCKAVIVDLAGLYELPEWFRMTK